MKSGQLPPKLLSHPSRGLPHRDQLNNKPLVIKPKNSRHLRKPRSAALLPVAGRPSGTVGVRHYAGDWGAGGRPQPAQPRHLGPHRAWLGVPLGHHLVAVGQSYLVCPAQWRHLGHRTAEQRRQIRARTHWTNPGIAASTIPNTSTNPEYSP